MNYFKIAARRKTRFPSTRGLLTAEQLYDLSLKALDETARAINTELKSLSEDSFIDLTPDPRRGHLADALELVKEVIADVQADADRAAARVTKAARRKALTEALATKEGEALSKASLASLRAELAALDAD